MSCLLLLISATSARAEISASEAIRLFESGDTQASAYLNGIETGLGWANASLIADNKPALFCVPEKIALTVHQQVDVMKKFIRSSPEFATRTAGQTMLFAFQEAFPCR
ncbi:Rap1a/Tai family immunity protein [Bradyrhizobium oligotrophicum]|uniref:Rap1a/Tai family immunity protein n=1 Tax=Bradyrhizobium oligotrophicum TaxID=44255 RepID=UPI003EBF0CDD